MTRNCQDCPSYMGPSDMFFKKSIGAPMCASFGHVLGRPGAPDAVNVKIGKHFSKDCPQYGEARPTTAPAKLSLQITMGDPTVKMAAMPSDAERNAVNNCKNCKNYVTPDAVRNDFGWAMGLCAATGRLLIDGRLGAEAKACSWRSPGPNRNSTTGIMLMPEYEDAFSSMDPVSAFIKRQGQPIIEPHDYPTDKDLDDDDRANGIMAWREIHDPAGTGNSTYLPIFDPDSFDEIEQAKIPRTGDDEHPEWYADHSGAVYKIAVMWMELDETPALWGVAGTGKTELLRHMAWLMCAPFERINITADSDLDDLAGKPGARGDGLGGTETYFEMGRIPKAWVKRCVLCLDEPNVAEDPAVWHFIRPMTDNSKQLVLDQDEGQRLPRNAYCFPGLAMNPAWDVRNAGANQLADADGNRLMHIFMPLPPEEIERSILKQRCQADEWELPDDVLDLVMKVAHDLRGLIDDAALPISWGIRPQIKVTRAMRWFDPLAAFKIAVTDSLEPSQAEMILDVVKTYVPQ